MKRVKATWLVGLVWLLLGPAHGALGATWETHNDAGREAYQQGDYGEAEKQFRAALRKAEGFEPQDPRLASALNNLVTCLPQIGPRNLAGPI